MVPTPTVVTHSVNDHSNDHCSIRRDRSCSVDRLRAAKSTPTATRRRRRFIIKALAEAPGLRGLVLQDSPRCNARSRPDMCERRCDALSTKHERSFWQLNFYQITVSASRRDKCGVGLLHTSCRGGSPPVLGSCWQLQPGKKRVCFVVRSLCAGSGKSVV